MRHTVFPLRLVEQTARIDSAMTEAKITSLGGCHGGDLDLSALRELRAESSQAGFMFLERFCEEWASCANRFSAPGEALFIATVEEEIVGICGLNRDPYTSNPRIGRVRRLYVARAHRRAGVGRELLKSVIAHARQHFSLLRVRTSAASAFYAAQGFRCVASDPEVTHVLELDCTA